MNRKTVIKAADFHERVIVTIEHTKPKWTKLTLSEEMESHYNMVDGIHEGLLKKFHAKDIKFLK